jgi:putative endonuclease
MASQTNAHILTGQRGESLAADYLQKQGYTILHRNYRYKRSEIDIIAVKDGLLIFVEVKTRTTDVFGFPEEAVNRRKERILLNAAEVFIHWRKWEKDIRFDIIAITLSATLPPFIHHIEDAFH